MDYLGESYLRLREGRTLDQSAGTAGEFEEVGEAVPIQVFRANPNAVHKGPGTKEGGTHQRHGAQEAEACSALTRAKAAYQQLDYRTV